jgi:hypothetical protein
MWGKIWWPIFLIISSVWLLTGFGIPEAWALISNGNNDNTLSGYARTELHGSVATLGSVHTLAWYLSFTVWIMFVVFITAHIWMDQFG